MFRGLVFTVLTIALGCVQAQQFDVVDQQQQQQQVGLRRLREKKVIQIQSKDSASELLSSLWETEGILSGNHRRNEERNLDAEKRRVASLSKFDYEIFGRDLAGHLSMSMSMSTGTRRALSSTTSIYDYEFFGRNLEGHISMSMSL